MSGPTPIARPGRAGAPEVTGLRVAWAVELTLLTRSTVVRLATPLLVLLVPIATVGLVALARSGRLSGTAAPKLAEYAVGDLSTTHLLVLGQVLAVAVLGAGGFAAAAAFGTPFADGTAGALFGLAVPRGTIALARCLVLVTWAATCVAASVAVTVGLSAVVGTPSGLPPTAWRAAATSLGAGLLAAGLALPFAWIATVTRSALGTVGALVGTVAVTQVVVLLGGGLWFPYAVPSLWTGTGGVEAAAAVGPAHLGLTAAMAPMALLAVVRAWRRLTDV